MLHLFKSKILIKATAAIAVLILLYTISVLLFIVPMVQQNSYEQEKKNAKMLLENTAKIVQNSYNELKLYEKNTLESRQKEIKDIIQMVLRLASKYQQRVQEGAISQEQAKAQVTDIISSMHFKDNYIFITTKECRVVWHPKQEFIGKDMGQVQDQYGTYFVKAMVEDAFEKGEGYNFYYWPRVEHDTAVRKVSYSAAFKEWGWMLGMGIYLDDVDSEIKIRKEEIVAQLADTLLGQTIGQNGYMYLFNRNKEILIYPHDREIEALIEPLLFDQAIEAFKGDKEFTYLWSKEEGGKRTQEKISWVEYIDGVEWYLISSAYTDDFGEASKRIAWTVMLFALTLLIVLVFVGLLAFRKLLDPIKELSDVALEVSKGDIGVRSRVRSNDEIGILAKEFNRMLDSLLDQIILLDDKVEEKTTELEQQKETLKERVKEEVERNRQKEQQLLQQSRLAQMGEMISMIAHQWRQPLTAISATTNNLTLKLMLGEVDKAEFTKEIGLINDYSQHLSHTIDDFRGFFKENKEDHEITLEEVIEHTLNIVMVSAEFKGIKIATNYGCHQKIMTYESELKQVVLNLVKNAEDILIEKGIKEPAITLTTGCQGDHFTIVVEDNAGGVPESIIEKIFDPYFSTKLEKDGTGLGLYMSKTIIEDHCGGKLSVHNSDKGAVFTIDIESLRGGGKHEG
jgi:signal transduction histidine kinase